MFTQILLGAEMGARRNTPNPQKYSTPPEGPICLLYCETNYLNFGEDFNPKPCVCFGYQVYITHCWSNLVVSCMYCDSKKLISFQTKSHLCNPVNLSLVVCYTFSLVVFAFEKRNCSCSHTACNYQLITDWSTCIFILYQLFHLSQLFRITVTLFCKQ